MNNELVNKINYAYELCDELDGLGYGIGYGYKQRDSLRVSRINVAMYFSVEVGKVTDKTVSLLKDYFDMEQPKEVLDGLYKTMFVDNVVYQDGDYSTKVPAEIQAFVMTDNKIYASSNDDTKSYAGYVADLYNAFGEEILAGSDDNAKAKFSAFMKMIVDYINENLAYNYSFNF